MLEVIDLECTRGDRRLFSRLSFRLDQGTLLHVQGRNGTGKTTLLRAICGLLLPQAGEIRWQGENIQTLKEDFGRELLYLGHLNGIKHDLTALENLRVAATLAGQLPDEGRLEAALRHMGLGGFEDLPTRVLSQGQKRRVALARLPVSQTRLWILDEPFTALDSGAVELLQGLIADQVAGGGLVILTTHQEVPLTAGQIRRLRLGS